MAQAQPWKVIPTQLTREQYETFILLAFKRSGLTAYIPQVVEDPESK